jgi:O-antigen/teichoic acid export membrane protein
VAAATLVTELFQLAANIGLCRSFIPALQVKVSLARLSILRILLKFGSVAAVIAVADILIVGMDSILIGKWVGLPAVGIYGIAVTILRPVASLVTSGMNVLMPRFAALDGLGDHEKTRQLLIKSLAVSSFLSFGGCMIAVVLAKQFILWWVGTGFAESVLILWVLSIGSAFSVAQHPSIGFMYAVNKHYYYAIAIIIEAAVNFSLSIILVFRYGMLGVALGTLIPMLIIRVCVMPLYVSRVAGLSLREYLRPILLPAILATGIMGLACWAGIITRSVTSTGCLLATGLGIGLVYILAYCLMMRLVYPALLDSMLDGRKSQA